MEGNFLFYPIEPVMSNSLPFQPCLVVRWKKNGLNMFLFLILLHHHYKKLSKYTPIKCVNYGEKFYSYFFFIFTFEEIFYYQCLNLRKMEVCVQGHAVDFLFWFLESSFFLWFFYFPLGTKITRDLHSLIIKINDSVLFLFFPRYRKVENLVYCCFSYKIVCRLSLFIILYFIFYVSHQIFFLHQIIKI